jgi:hypothetical protein
MWLSGRLSCMPACMQPDTALATGMIIALLFAFLCRAFQIHRHALCLCINTVLYDTVCIQPLMTYGLMGVGDFYASQFAGFLGLGRSNDNLRHRHRTAWASHEAGGMMGGGQRFPSLTPGWQLGEQAGQVSDGRETGHKP